MTEAFEIKSIVDSLEEDSDILLFEINTIPGMKEENKKIAMEAYNKIIEIINILKPLAMQEGTL